MKLSRTSFALMATLLAGTALPTFANATVTVLGWPGGSEETALRATVETYNKQASDADKVELLFF
ncbi:sugar ABC transporter substrate-binding protein, partial [Mesorhizobium sp. M7A.F.Ca.ET.027.03.2.1]